MRAASHATKGVGLKLTKTLQTLAAQIFTLPTFCPQPIIGAINPLKTMKDGVDLEVLLWRFANARSLRYMFDAAAC